MSFSNRQERRPQNKQTYNINGWEDCSIGKMSILKNNCYVSCNFNQSYQRDLLSSNKSNLRFTLKIKWKQWKGKRIRKKRLAISV